MASKKRKLQSSTLHNFFPSASNPSPKNRSKWDRSPTPQDVIVVDSDDDRVKSARKLGRAGSSDIEFVDGRKVQTRAKHQPLRNNKHISRRLITASSPGEKKGRKASNPSEKSRPLCEVPVGNDGGSLFGTPSLLLRQSNPRSPTDIYHIPSAASDNAVSHHSQGPLFIPSTSLLCPIRQRSSSRSHGVVSISTEESHSHPPAEIANRATAASLVYVEDTGIDTPPDTDLTIESLDEKWGTDDDEKVLGGSNLDEDEDMDDIEIVSLPAPAENDNQIAICPVCSMRLLSFHLTEVQNHINGCLDLSSTRVPRPQTSRPPSPLKRSHIQDPTSTSRHGSKSNRDAFSVLMSSHQDNEARNEEPAVEDRTFRPTKNNSGRRKAPFHKVLQGMPIAVDAFRYGTIPGVTAYFLTHAHSDHYTNLASNWTSGPIYCSEGTANLIIHMLSVDPKWVHPLPMDVPTIIPDTSGVRVTLIEANHCPGSCLFLYEGPQTVNAGDSAYKSCFVGLPRIFRYLHCGDFRASPQHVLHPAVKGKKIDHVYLDTTYLNPKYNFPPQPLVISACRELARRLVTGEDRKTMARWVAQGKSPEDKHEEGRILIVVGTYSIGKERIVKEIAKALQTKVYCDARKAALLRCQPDPELHALLTSNPLDACVHVVPLSLLTTDKLRTYVERFKGTFSKAVGFRPTGWTYTQPAGSEQIASIIARSQKSTFTYENLHPARGSTPTLQLFPVPYSEHSSFFELTCFAMSFNWGKMIATVNVESERSRGRMAKWIEKWETERKKRKIDIIIAHREPDYW